MWRLCQVYTAPRPESTLNLADNMMLIPRSAQPSPPDTGTRLYQTLTLFLVVNLEKLWRRYMLG